MNSDVKHSIGGGRIIGLDMLRIALALLIFMFHSQLHFHCSYGKLNSFVSMGAIAMTGFIMLSGYVLWSTYSTKDIWTIGNMKSFYIKRLITILPLYYSIIFLRNVYQLCTGLLPISDEAFLFPVEIFVTQSTFFSLFRVSHNGGTWFISCILICYAIYPFLQHLLLQMTEKTGYKFLGVLCAILLYAPIVGNYFQLEWVTIYANPFYRLIEFAIGMILAQIISAHKDMLCRFSNVYTLLLTTFLLIILVSVAREIDTRPHDYMLFNWIALPCFSALIMILSTMKFQQLQQSKVIKYLSGISFTFFLCQVLPLWKYSRHICAYINSDTNIVRIIISFTLCVLGAVVIHECIEKPASRCLKMKFLRQ